MAQSKFISDYWSQLQDQDNIFGDYGSVLTADAVTKNIPQLRDSIKTQGYDLSNYDASKLSSDFTGLTKDLSQKVGLASSTLKDDSLWGDFKSALGGDANFGKNLLDIGKFGLGLAQYLDMKPMLEKQGALLDQKIANNRIEMAATQDTREALAQRV